MLKIGEVCCFDHLHNHLQFFASVYRRRLRLKVSASAKHLNNPMIGREYPVRTTDPKSRVALLLYSVAEGLVACFDQYAAEFLGHGDHWQVTRS